MLSLLVSCLRTRSQSRLLCLPLAKMAEPEPEPAATAGLTDLLDWFRGAEGCKLGNLEVAQYEYEGRGLRATADIKKGNPLLCCPLRLVFSARAARAEPTRPRAGIFCHARRPFFAFCSPDGGRRVGLTLAVSARHSPFARRTSPRSSPPCRARSPRPRAPAATPTSDPEPPTIYAASRVSAR